MFCSLEITLVLYQSTTIPLTERETEREIAQNNSNGHFSVCLESNGLWRRALQFRILLLPSPKTKSIPFWRSAAPSHNNEHPPGRFNQVLQISRSSGAAGLNPGEVLLFSVPISRSESPAAKLKNGEEYLAWFLLFVFRNFVTPSLAIFRVHSFQNRHHHYHHHHHPLSLFTRG